jgi:hypothetical protein
MRSEKLNAPPKAYDAIEDAISQSKKDLTRSGDDLVGTTLKRTVDKGEQNDASQNNDKVAAKA